MDTEVRANATRDTQAPRAVLEALTEHPNKLGVKIKALGALENMAGSEQGARTLIHASAVPIVSSLLSVSILRDEMVVVRCCHVLAAIAYYEEDHEEVMQRCKVAEIAIDVQRRFPGENERCLKAADRLLTCLEEGRSLFPT
jgi:hypothetical protein